MPYVWTLGQALLFVCVAYLIRMEKRVAVIETEITHIAKNEEAHSHMLRRLNRLERQVAVLKGEDFDEGD